MPLGANVDTGRPFMVTHRTEPPNNLVGTSHGPDHGLTVLCRVKFTDERLAKKFFESNALLLAITRIGCHCLFVRVITPH
jgi:hypothetical protein